MVVELFRWWYTDGWRRAAGSFTIWTRGVERAFSAKLLLQTLFSPWRRIVTYGGRTIDDKLHAMLDNVVSRIVGFFVRFFALLAALVLFAVASVAGLMATVGWPLIPLLLPICFILGVIG